MRRQYHLNKCLVIYWLSVSFVVGSSVKPMPQFPVLLVVNKSPPPPRRRLPPTDPSSPPLKDVHEREEHCVRMNKQCAELCGGATERGELTARQPRAQYLYVKSKQSEEREGRSKDRSTCVNCIVGWRGDNEESDCDRSFRVDDQYTAFVPTQSIAFMSLFSINVITGPSYWFCWVKNININNT